MLVRPIGTKPAVRRRATAGAAEGAGGASRSATAQGVIGVGGRARGLAINLQIRALAFAGGVLDAIEAPLDQRPARLSGLKPRRDLVQRAHGSTSLVIRPLGVVCRPLEPGL